MGHAAARRHTRPHHAALLETELFLLGLTDDGRVELAPDRRGTEMPGPEHVAFLVHERSNHEAAPERCVASLDGSRRYHGRRQTTLHVGGASTVDAPVHQICTE